MEWAIKDLYAEVVSFIKFPESLTLETAAARTLETVAVLV